MDRRPPADVGAVGVYAAGQGSLTARDVGGERQYRRAGAVRVHHALDEVRVTGPAAARADREPPGQLRLGRRGERGGLLVVHVDPVDAAALGAAGPAHRVAERVQAVAYQPVNAVHAPGDKHVKQIIGNVSHEMLPWFPLNRPSPRRIIGSPAGRILAHSLVQSSSPGTGARAQSRAKSATASHPGSPQV